MRRRYLVDGYNVILRDDRLDGLVHERGLADARRAFREELEEFGRRERCRVRVIYDGARGPFDHRDSWDGPWVEAGFTSAGEKADERVVAAAIELRRNGYTVCVVSDDEAGVRRPAEAAGVEILSTREFLRRVRSRPDPDAREGDRTRLLSASDREDLARNFLARDAERRRSRPVAPPPPAPLPPCGIEADRLPASGRRTSPPPQSASSTPAPGRSPAQRPAPPDIAADLKAKRERGARKQARRLALRAKKPGR